MIIPGEGKGVGEEGRGRGEGKGVGEENNLGKRRSWTVEPISS